MNREFLLPLVQSQRWKLWLAALGGVVVAIAYIAPEEVTGIVDAEPATLRLFAIVAGLVTMVALWASVRCPSCGLKLVWHAMSTESARAWLSWLLDAKSCPKCGYRPPPRV